MDKVLGTDVAAKFNIHELCDDYKRKVNAACNLALVHHEQDEHGATLVIHIPGPNIEADSAGAKLSERLGSIIADLPKPSETDMSLTETVNESQKAVVDKPAAKGKRKTDQSDGSATGT